MYRRSLLSFLTFCAAFTLSAQTTDVQHFRTIDGKFNNLQHPDWGAAGSDLLIASGLYYGDQVSSPAGASRPNPRQISNSLFAQEGLINDPLNLSDFCWVWGQFIDHDFGLTPDGVEPAMIQVPTGDLYFDPAGTGQVVIPMTRNAFDPGTGTGVDNPRRHPNVITSFIDGSGVYGSDETRAGWLRSFSGGKLKVSAGNMPPFNTVSGLFNDAIDQAAPPMANPTGISSKYYVCGDERANENPLLLSFHTLFLREHNRQCAILAKQHPDWTDEQLYQHARKMVSGLIQSIVYDEWLPVMGVVLSEYAGYNPDINPGLDNLFTAAAFRLGHTLLNGTLRRMDNNGEVMALGNVQLRDAFFNPYVMIETGGIEPFFKGMATQTQQRLDPRVIDDVRNFLFGPPGAGGLDLAAININRGRDRGLPDFNTVRAFYGLTPYSYFQQFTPDAAIFTRLLSLYVDINNVDPWVGFLAEKPKPGSLFGETLLAAMTRQFQALRDGDRFFFLNDPVLTAEEKDWITRTTLRDIIMYNTGISLMQDNVFDAMPHSEICDHMTGSLIGHIRTEDGLPVPGVSAGVTFTDDVSISYQTVADGLYSFEDLPSCKVENLGFSKGGSVIQGVTTFDIILLQKHILGVEHLDSPYKIIAADIDNSKSITTLDIIRLRKVILGIDIAFPNNQSWRFVAATYEFEHPDNPLSEDFPEILNFGGSLAGLNNLDFVAIKVGDLNNSYTPVNAGPGDPSAAERTDSRSLALSVEDLNLEQGQSYEIPLTAGSGADAVGCQFTLRIDPSKLKITAVRPGVSAGLSADNFALFAESGLVAASWNSPGGRESLQPGAALAYVTVEALEERVDLHDAVAIVDDITASEAYDSGLNARPVTLQFEAASAAAQPFALYQNRPNPFAEQTVIPFDLDQTGQVELSVFDAAGRLVVYRKAALEKGRNELLIARDELGETGVFYYQLKTDAHLVSRKMIMVDPAR